MYNHSGTTDFLKLVAVMGFVVLAVSWLSGVIGASYTVIVLGPLVLVAVFAGGAVLSMAIQRNTLNSITRFNHDDAQIDRYRQQSFKALAQGESAMQRAAAQLQVLDARRTNQIASQQAKLLVDTERAKWEAQQQRPAKDDVWAWDGDDGDNFQAWG